MLQIHQKIEQARLAAGLTQEEMAEKIGIKRSTYQYWEEKDPSIDKVKKVARALNLSDDYFFGKEEQLPEVTEALSVDLPTMQVIIKLAESNSKLSDGNKELIESNRIALENTKIIAEANRTLARSNEELVQMTKQSIADASPQSKSAFEPNWGKLLAVLARVGTGKHWQTEEEGIAVLHSEIYGGQVPKISAHTQTRSDTKHSGKGS